MRMSTASSRSSTPPVTVRGDDHVRRCWWCGADSLYIDYHDAEWGVPVADERGLYEKIVLEGFQAGLSWITILRKRARFREVFHGFDPERVAAMTSRDVDRLLGDAGIIRHRRKIESAIQNAARVLEMRNEEGGLAALLWRFEPARSPVIRARADVRPHTPESTALSRELRRRGWTFVGPTTMHAFMQSVGMLNDHALSCGRRAEIDALRRRFTRPGTS